MNAKISTNPEPAGQLGSLSVVGGSAVSPIIVELSQLAAVFAYLARIESVPLADITWLNNGEAVKLTPERIDEWKFTGLNNRDFARVELLPSEVLPNSVSLNNPT